jgi:hypothetical protein
MKYTIILIIIIIIIIILNKHKNINEKLIDMSDEDTVNKVFNNCGNRKGKVQFEKIKIMGNVNNKSKNQFLLDLAYPIGSYYVQYESVASNKTSEAFPVSRSPAVLFGGDWQEQWKYESIFFRTSGPLSEENRVNGFQNYATQRLQGDTTYSQMDYNSAGKGNSGIFDSYMSWIGTDDGRDGDPVTRVKFDLSGYYNDDKASFANSKYPTENVSYVSDLETRPKNRIIKVWKRVQRDASGNLPPPLANGYPYTEYDENYYEGPEQHKYLNTTIPGIPVDQTGILYFEKAMQFCNAQKENCTHISFAEGIWRYGNNEAPIEDVSVQTGSIGGSEKPNYKVWTKKVSGVQRVNRDT